ncbi:hypothetical protein W97_04691 [Coniosporium apollinis CBS 100218]|uniref:Uncharacterized protein n=1 Tax=Coniosporium apollinis (strain CBS 100218) TaxID=1168221 RepID=R7YUC3_CONA1|nr:uncharacterized protein W97_04691 [Coniosporium apollinis CBS 100218]EON65453.1 hypothetical protein W97_04691 [Coniosporium apollinis CBS 100218]
MGALGNLVPLIILFVFLAVGAWIFLFANEMADRGVKKMEKKNVSFTKDGMRVGVKDVQNEEYADRTQSVLVKAWQFAGLGGGDKTGSSQGAKKRA